MKCGHSECSFEAKEKRKYCSLSCRNKEVNKTRDYSKNKESLKIVYKNKQVLKLDKFCKICCTKLLNDSYIYCSTKCSGTSSNGRIHTQETKKKISVALRKTKLCRNCDVKFQSKRAMFCGPPCIKLYKRRNMDGYQKYREDCRFNFSPFIYPNEFDFTLLIKHGWYSPANRRNNLKGVSKDHMLSVLHGYKNGIDPLLLAHPANCQLMLQSDNSRKRDKSSITLDELKEKINNWCIKYP